STIKRANPDDRTIRAIDAIQSRWEGLRSESEQRVLFYDSLTQLSRLDDPDDMLVAICERVRRTFDCDVSYISIYDHENDINYTRTSTGNPLVHFNTVK